jgi:hypothetical protein
VIGNPGELPVSELERPIRVVLFGGGPTLDPGAGELLVHLEAHPEIEFLAAFCESQEQTLKAVAVDLWRRRRWLAPPLLLLHLLAAAGRWLSSTPRRGRRGQRALLEKIRYVPDIHAPAVLGAVREIAPDLGLIYGSPILKPALFGIPSFGTLGIHHGKLPEYRGKKTTFWAMFNGECSAGVTIQRVNEGLDTGEVIREGEVPIGMLPLAVVWRRLEALGLDLYLRAILDVKQGRAHPRAPVGRRRRLYRDPRARDILEFWRRYCVRLLRRS